MKKSKPTLSVFTSLILRETAASSVVPDRTNKTVRVQIQGEEAEREIPEEHFIYAICTREDPPHFLLRFLDTYNMAVEVTKLGVDFSVGKDREGFRMLMNSNLLQGSN